MAVAGSAGFGGCCRCGDGEGVLNEGLELAQEVWFTRAGAGVLNRFSVGTQNVLDFCYTVIQSVVAERKI